MELKLQISCTRATPCGLFGYQLLLKPSSNLALSAKQKNDGTKWSTVCCASFDVPSLAAAMPSLGSNPAPPVMKKRKRYRKQYPGEKKGITEEMRFVAMRLRNVNGKKVDEDGESDNEGKEEDYSSEKMDGETWKPSITGFLKYLVDSELVFRTLETIVNESEDVSYAYFRKTGLERSESISKDLEWFRRKEFKIPEPSSPGASYSVYLKELAKKSAPMFLAHLYNIYFSHIYGGQIIAKQVSEKLLEGRELELYKWEDDVTELLKMVRGNLNLLGEHWSRDVKNKCLKEATKSFRYLGQIIRLIIVI